jgi:hypothetical protein
MTGGIAVPGDAVATNVQSGKTFSSGAGVGLTGTLSTLSYTPTVIQHLAGAGASQDDFAVYITGVTTTANHLLQIVTGLISDYGAYVTSITDTSGNTWVPRFYINTSVPGVAGPAVWTTNGPTAALVDGDITVNISIGSPGGGSPGTAVCHFSEITNAPLYAPFCFMSYLGGFETGDSVSFGGNIEDANTLLFGCASIISGSYGDYSYVYPETIILSNVTSPIIWPSSTGFDTSIYDDGPFDWVGLLTLAGVVSGVPAANSSFSFRYAISPLPPDSECYSLFLAYWGIRSIG